MQLKIIGRKNAAQGWIAGADVSAGFDRRSAFDRRRVTASSARFVTAWRSYRRWIAINHHCSTAFTLAEIQAGIATEGNPVLSVLWSAHPLAAIALKIGLVGAVTLTIWQTRRYRMVLWVAVAAMCAFTIVVAYHLGSLTALGLI
jgi:hypothetical protein